MISFIKSTIKEAGKIFHSSKTTIIGEKEGNANWTTEADLAVESFIINQIKTKFPKHLIISEESQIPQVTSNDKNIWIIDPLDGTTNAARKIPFFGISIAYFGKGEIQAGAIYDLNTGKLYWAEKDKGAFVDNRKLIIKNHSLKNALVVVGIPYKYENFAVNHKFMLPVFKKGAKLACYGSSVIESMFVAEGKIELYFEAGIKPWDIAAAKLIIEEAGGVAESFKNKLNIFHPETFVCGSKQAVKEFKALL